MALSAAQIQEIYLAVLQRSASTTDANSWSAATMDGALTDAQVISDIVNSTEAVEYVDPIVRIYQAAFNRVPDQAGLKGWENAFKAGTLTELQIISDFIGSSEFTTRFGATNPSGAPTSAFIQLLYENVLNRQGSASEVSAWLNSGQTNAQIMQAFVNSTEFITDTQTAVTTFLTNAAIYNLSPTDPSLPSITTNPYSGSLLATKFVLTPGADHATANIFYGDLTPYNINGVGPTLNSDDVLTGTGNNPQLIVTDGYAGGLDAIPAGVSLTNIQQIILNTNGNAGNGGAPWNTAPFAGVLVSNITSAGNGTDTVAGAATTAITVNHDNPANLAGSGTAISGGSSVTVNAAGGFVSIGVAGSPSTDPSGAITLTDGTIANAAVTIFGGTNVSVNMTAAANTAPITIGNGRAGALNQDPSGSITITDAGAGAIQTYGGTSVNITETPPSGVAPGAITIGSATGAAPEDSGAITVIQTAATGYDDLTGAGNSNTVGGAITVYGGTTVNVTTNSGGGVTIGSATTGTANPLNPTGAITVTDTSTDLAGAFGLGEGYDEGALSTTIFGGTTVTVIEAGGGVTIGNGTFDPTGAVSVTESKISHRTVSIDGGNGVTVSAQGQTVEIGTNAGTAGAQVVTQSASLTGKGMGGAAGSVTVDGGTTVTVNTTGGSVQIGGSVVGSEYAPTGAVSITDTFSGTNCANSDSFDVQGGSTVNITTTPTAQAITVGTAVFPVLLNVGGTALKTPTQFATGNVTINDAQTNGSTTTYGTGDVNVATNGGTTVSITGGAVQNVVDVQSTIATGGPNAGKAIGTSTLSTVTLDGVQTTDVTTIQSNALASLSILDYSLSGNIFNVVDNTAAHALALKIGNDSGPIEVEDNFAGTLSVTDDGKVSTGILTLSIATATSVTFNNSTALSTDLAGNDDLTTITATGAGALSLGNVSTLTALTAIDAATATGGITATVDDVTTSFTGGSGNNVITITSVTNGTTKAISGGSGDNTLIEDFTGGSAAVVGISGFQTLGLGTLANGTYNASGFSALTVGDTAGNVSFVSADAGATLAITASNANQISYALATPTGNDTLSLSIGGAAAVVAPAVIAAEIETLNIASVSGAANTLTIGDSQATTINITGTQALTLTLAANNLGALTSTTSVVSNINASASSGAVNVTGVPLDASVLATITGGSGLLTADGSNQTKAIETIATGSGGGVIQEGFGGSWNTALHSNAGGYDIGSETINLAASAGVVDTIDVLDGALVANNGVTGGITGFEITSNSQTSDVLSFANTKTELVNVVTPVIVGTLIGGATKVLATDVGAVIGSDAYMSNLTYTVANGIITFGAVGGHTISEFTTGQLIVAAETIVQTAIGTDHVAAFTTGGNTYVIASQHTAYVNYANPDTSGGAIGLAAGSVTELVGVSGVQGFGGTEDTGIGATQPGTAAANTIMANIVAENAGHTGQTGTTTFNDTGFSEDTLDPGAGGSANTTTYDNLAAWAQLDVGSELDVGNVFVNQVGSAGANSLVIDFITGVGTEQIDSLTVNGDNTITIAALSGGTDTITSLTDSANTLATIIVSGDTPVTIGAITDTALKTVNASALTTGLSLGTAIAPISQAGLTLELGQGADDVFVSGAADKITDSLGGATVTANGSGDTITLGNGTNVVVANGPSDVITLGTGTNTLTANGVGDTINLSTGSNTVHASGSADTITFTGTATTASTVDGGGVGLGIGPNSTVTFGSTWTYSETISLTGDVTGATSSGAFEFTTLKNVFDCAGDNLTFGNATNEAWANTSATHSQVNVATVTTLPQALDLAASQAAAAQSTGELAANTGDFDWFQFQGNTYIVEAINDTASAASHPALAVDDVVVKIVGLVNLSGAHLSGDTITL